MHRAILFCAAHEGRRLSAQEHRDRHQHRAAGSALSYPSTRIHPTATPGVGVGWSQPSPGCSRGPRSPRPGMRAGPCTGHRERYPMSAAACRSSHSAAATTTGGHARHELQYARCRPSAARGRSRRGLLGNAVVMLFLQLLCPLPAAQIISYQVGVNRGGGGVPC